MFTIIYENGFYKDLDRLPDADVERIMISVEDLANTPTPNGCKKLKSKSGVNIFRIRQGDYRVIYLIDRVAQRVNVLSVRHRKDVYKNIP
ncbi:MAG: type II toxin-antitoxin system RelE/ParE family toxin [Candidatus Omnitrophica bacterium]|nr:type II toxin-antitoxin system RelE/ParE family toxin [Candidatus Omnitrophota bacterium]